MTKFNQPDGPGRFLYQPPPVEAVVDNLDGYLSAVFTDSPSRVIFRCDDDFLGTWERIPSGAPEVEPSLPKGVTYGGRGPAGEYYSRHINPLAAISIWTEDADGEHWTADELEAIVRHKRWVDAQKSEKPQEVEPDWRDKPEGIPSNVYVAWWYSRGKSVLPALVRQGLVLSYCVPIAIVDGELSKPVSKLPGKWHPWNNGVKPTPYVE